MVVTIGGAYFDISLLKEIISIIDGIITGITAIFLACVSYTGLNTWKKQLMGKSEYDAAKRLFNSLHRVRNSITQLRRNIIIPLETAEALRELDIEHTPDNDSEYPYLSLQAVYQKRLSTVKSAYQEFTVTAFEAEALWGEPVKPLIDRFNIRISSLFLAVEAFLDSQRPDSTHSPEDVITETIFAPSLVPVVFDSRGNIDYSQMNVREDQYASELDESIAKIESFIKPKLKL